MSMSRYKEKFDISWSIASRQNVIEFNENYSLNLLSMLNPPLNKEKNESSIWS